MAITKQHNLQGQKADLPVGFKLTELGPLPEKWEVVRLGEIVESIKSGDWGKQGSAGDHRVCLVLRGTDFQRAELGDLGSVPLRYIKQSHLKKLVLKPEGLLVELSGGSKVQPTGRVMLVSSSMVKKTQIPIIFSNFVKRIIPSEKVDPRYMRLYWEFLYQLGRTRIYEKRTTGIRNFKLQDFLDNEVIFLPPLPEQQAIAYVLCAVHRAKEAAERLIAAARELKKSLMRHLFTYGLVPLDQVDQVKLKETEIGLVPEHWEVVPVGQLGKIVTGTTPRTSIRQFYNGPFPFIAPGDLGESRYVWRTAKTLSLEGLKVSRVIPEGSVVVVCIGATIGKVALATAKKSTTNQQINTIIPNKDLALAEYLHDALSYRAPDLPSLAGRAAVPIVNKSVFASFLVPQPSLSEQQEIARTLQTVDCKIEAEGNRKAALEVLFKSLLHHLMRGKLRVPVQLYQELASGDVVGGGD